MSTRVLVAGTFDPEFARNRVLVSLLEQEGFEVEIVRRSSGDASALCSSTSRSYACCAAVSPRIPVSSGASRGPSAPT